MSGYTWVANTFEKVDGSVTKLSDLAFEPAPAPTAVKLYLLSKSGATEEIDGKKQIFIYVGPAKCTKNNGWIPGWYYFTLNGTQVAAAQFKLGSESAYWANNVELPYGQGFGINKTTATVSIVFSGSVANEDKPIPATNSGYTWMGNVMPTDMKLSDLAFDPAPAPTAVKHYKLSKTGATEEIDGKKQIFIYVGPAKCTKANGWIPGWYYFTLNGTQVAVAQFKLGSESAYWANDVEIKAGEGFGINKTTATVSLIVPSPLVDHAAAE